MAHTDLQHPDLHLAASSWSEEQTLQLCAVYSNPFRWRARRELANDFRRHIAAKPNIRLVMVELAYGDRPFEVTSEGCASDVQLRTRSELFHKENLINVGVSRFPPGWRYGAFSDADFTFTRHDLGLETIHQLQHYDWVQMFSQYVNVSGETEPGKGHRQVGSPSNGFAYGYVSAGCALPSGYCGGWGEPAQSGVPASPGMPWIGSPGGAWAFRREAFDVVGGMLDRCVLGSGDWFMAFGLAGQVLSVEVERRLGKRLDRYPPAYLEYIRAWQDRAAVAIRGNVGFVDGFAVHHWHGPLAKRGYGSRDDILIRNAFHPLRDVCPDWQGVLQLAPGKPRLRDDIRAYFLSRSEDLPHLG